MGLLKKLGIKGRFVFAFALMGIGIVVGGTIVFREIQRVAVQKEVQKNFFEGSKTIQEIQTMFASANLLGMDILVDHSEDSAAKVSREGEFAELRKEYYEKNPVWIEGLEKMVSKDAVSKTLSYLDKIFETEAALINSINTGETKVEVYAKYDEDIDRAKESGVAMLSDIMKAVESLYNESQANMDQSFSKLTVSLLIACGLCLSVLVFVVGPIVLSLSSTIAKLQARLSQIATTMTGTSSNLAGASDSLAESATESAAAIQESVSAITQINSMLANTSKHATETSNISEEVLEHSQKGLEVMKSMTDSMAAISDSSSRLSEIVQMINNITNKTNIINDVVFKTQLLAVNASIEAARAGQHGKGFSVVANEVASLAALSGKASNEIRELLYNSSTRVKEIVDGTSSSIKDGEQASKKTAEVFESIAQSVSIISDKVGQIKTATKEQETGISQTSTALNQMNQATGVTNSMANQNAVLSREVNSLAEHLKRIERSMRDLVYGEGGKVVNASGDHGDESLGGGDLIKGSFGEKLVDLDDSADFRKSA